MKKLSLFLLIISLTLYSCIIPLNEESSNANNEIILTPPENITILPYTVNTAIISWQENTNINRYYL